ncbi:hypothetical protein RFI_22726, partial [Reticulomyxa filosa]
MYTRYINLNIECKLTKAELVKQWQIIDIDESGSIDFNEFKRLMTANFDDSNDAKMVIQRALSNSDIISDTEDDDEKDKKEERTRKMTSPRATKVAIPITSKSVKERKQVSTYTFNLYFVSDKNDNLEKKLRDIFDSIDYDKSGAIDLDEIYNDLKREFEFLDTNGSRGIDFEEFRNFMTTRWEDPSSPNSSHVAIATTLQRAFSEEMLRP